MRFFIIGILFLAGFSANSQDIPVLSSKYEAKLSKIENPKKKLKKYRKYFTKDSLKWVKNSENELKLILDSIDNFHVENQLEDFIGKNNSTIKKYVQEVPKAGSSNSLDKSLEDNFSSINSLKLINDFPQIEQYSEIQQLKTARLYLENLKQLKSVSDSLGRLPNNLSDEKIGELIEGHFGNSPYVKYLNQLKSERQIMTEKLNIYKERMSLIGNTDKAGYFGSICATLFGFIVPALSVQIVPVE